MSYNYHAIPGTGHGRLAVVTGASSGIGAAAARALALDGWKVLVAARRLDRLEQLAQEIDAIPVQLDVTDPQSVAHLAEVVTEHGGAHVLVNNAGGAKGLDSVVESKEADWEWMFETNVMGTLRVTQALVAGVIANDGLVINIGSIAARVPYVGGSGYNAAKHGVAALNRVLRLENADKTLRVTEIDPGRVATEEFSLVRFGGDQAKADAVYADKLNLTAEDIAEAIRWVASLPSHVNIDSLQIMPRDQV